MVVTHPAGTKLRVADEVFLIVALMHRENPKADDFSISEILTRAQSLNLTGQIRPGLEIHIRQHCVANLRPNPGNYRMLFASSKGRRRLLRPTDPVHSGRDGKIWPDASQIPPEWGELVSWTRARYGAPVEEDRWLDAIIQLQGSGKQVWKDESADEYVLRLRDHWA